MMDLPCNNRFNDSPTKSQCNNALKNPFTLSETYSMILLKMIVGLVFMDATNAFACLSRSAAIYNCRVLWFMCSIFLCSFHQCDPLALLVYSLVILPLTRKLKKSWKMEAELVCWCFWMSCYAYITSWMVTIFFIKDGPNNGYFFQNKKKAKWIFSLQK